MRDYQVMRDAISVVAESRMRTVFSDFDRVQPNDLVLGELKRLISDGLVDGAISFDSFGTCETFRIDGLTEEGRAFWRLLENERVWRIIRDTLRKADVDVSYPLLKEVCEEIVKRYVVRFIPEKIEIP